VSQCSTETLFEDLFKCEETRATLAKTGPTATSNDLIKYMNKFLQNQDLTMTMRQYVTWKEKKKEPVLLQKYRLAY
jgi:hypothetical protein